MRCEMCGNETATPHRVRVEGSVLLLCDNCSRFGEILDPPVADLGAGRLPSRSGSVVDQRLAHQAQRRIERDLFQELPELELAPDWPKRIRQAREKLNWTPEDLAKRLNEKKSIVLKLEAGGFHPSDATVRKVEHLLRIRLRADLAGAA